MDNFYRSVNINFHCKLTDYLKERLMNEIVLRSCENQFALSENVNETPATLCSSLINPTQNAEHYTLF